MHAAFVLLLLLLGPSLVVGIHSAGIMMLDPTVGCSPLPVLFVCKARAPLWMFINFTCCALRQQYNHDALNWLSFC